MATELSSFNSLLEASLALHVAYLGTSAQIGPARLRATADQALARVARVTVARLPGFTVDVGIIIEDFERFTFRLRAYALSAAVLATSALCLSAFAPTVQVPTAVVVVVVVLCVLDLPVAAWLLSTRIQQASRRMTALEGALAVAIAHESAGHL